MMETCRLRTILLSMIIIFEIGICALETKASSDSILKSNKRLTIFISDLHIGPGKDDETPKKWRNVEDFRWNEEFSLFLDFVNTEGKGNVDLIILGDMLELWQTANMNCTGQGTNLRCTVTDCEYRDKEIGCTEDEALKRTERIMSQHTKTFDSLRNFVSKESNRIIILPGNHDAALLYPRVAQKLISALVNENGKDTDCKDNNKVCISKIGYWFSSDGRIYVDHGHSFDKANRFDHWPVPFVTREGQIYLERPVGEQMVQKFYNRYEERFPILDNLASESEGITLGFQTEGINLIDDFAEFARFLLLKISWGQFWDLLGEQKEGQPPKWDIKKILKEDSPQFLVDSIPASDPLRLVAEESLKEGKFKLRPSHFTIEELTEICDYKLLRKKKGDTEVEECPRAEITTGRIYDKIADRDDEIMAEHLFSAYDARRAVDPTAKRFSVYVYGHTHDRSKDKMTLKKKERNPWELMVINTGAFQRVINKKQLKQLQKNHRSQGQTLQDREILNTLMPEDLPACYTFVRVDPYSDKPDLKLLYWAKDKTGAWAQNEQCIFP